MDGSVAGWPIESPKDLNPRSWPECDGHLARLVTEYGFTHSYQSVKRFVNELAEANLDGSRKEFIESAFAWPLLIIDDLGMRKCH
jgi:hypothetical protein